MRLIGRVLRSRLEDGTMVRLDDPPYHVLVTLVGERPVAIEDACNHAGASLSEGERTSPRGPEADARHRPHVECPMHGYIFDLATGRLVAPRGLCGDQRVLHADLEGDYVVVRDPGPNLRVEGLGLARGSGREE